jgi:hypothetical protein
MISIKRFLLLAVLSCSALAFATLTARAQETPAPAAATPPPATGNPTIMDREYDGQLHLTGIPYLWLPSIKTNLGYQVPTLPRHKGGKHVESTIEVGPSDYISKINSGALVALNARMGLVSVFGDYIYTNVSSTTSTSTTITGPLGHVSIPVTFNTNSRTASTIWELAAGYALAHGHNADLNLFAGWRQFPINVTLDYSAVIGKQGILTPSGSLVVNELSTDVIGGLQGKAFFNGDHWYVPYYIDIGEGNNNSTWQGFTGAGYTFSHGQSLVATYRTLNYYSFAPGSPVKKLTLSGPLLGYTFGL